MRLRDDSNPDSTRANAAVVALSEDIRESLDSGRATWPSLVALLSRPDAARTLAISVCTLDELIAKGELTPTRIGRSVRVSTTEIADFIQRKTHPPAPDTYEWPMTGQRRRVGSRNR